MSTSTVPLIPQIYTLISNLDVVLYNPSGYNIRIHHGDSLPPPDTDDFYILRNSDRIVEYFQTSGLNTYGKVEDPDIPFVLFPYSDGIAVPIVDNGVLTEDGFFIVLEDGTGIITIEP